MTTVADVGRWLEAFAPSRLAEPWDNVGLLWGDPTRRGRAGHDLLDRDDRDRRRGDRGRAELIVSHHPVLFKAVKTVRADRPEAASLWRLARAGVAIASPHTAFDNTRGGINDCWPGGSAWWTSARSGHRRPRPMFKVGRLHPPDRSRAVSPPRSPRGPAGSGTTASARSPARASGRSSAPRGRTPPSARPGRRETVREQRVEMVCPAERLAAVLAAIRSRHSYEEPAIDVYPLQPSRGDPASAGSAGSARPSLLRRSSPRGSARRSGSAGVQVVGDAGPTGRAGGDRLRRGGRLPGRRGRGAGADVLLTGEARFHRRLEAEARGLGLVVAGHHATERRGRGPGRADLRGLPALTVWASRQEHDPLRTL